MRILAGLLGLIGLAIAFGGVWLVALGGSPYYVIGGLAVLASGLLLWRGDARGGWLYAIFLIGTLVWALAEVGLDGWQLMPRLVGPALFGLIFLLPPIRRALAGRSALASPAAAILCLATVGLAAFLPGPDAVPDRELPSQRVAEAGIAGEWPAYGRTLAEIGRASCRERVYACV